MRRCRTSAEGAEFARNPPGIPVGAPVAPRVAVCGDEKTSLRVTRQRQQL